MNVELRTPDQLTDKEVSLWVRFRRENASLDSPYFCLDYTRAVGRVRDDVEVAVLRYADRVVGFFPFQRHAKHFAKPVGGRLSDYQGIIAPRTRQFDARRVLRRCELSTWNFDHVIGQQSTFEPFQRVSDLSPYLDLSDGFAEYTRSLRKAGRDELKATHRKGRKIEREIGPLRFEFRSQCEEAFDLLLQWKSQQFRRTKVTDVFSFPWTVDLLREIWQQSTSTFAGSLSVLYAGDRPIAAHFGMQSESVLHWWFPTYDPALASYSPGRVLLAKLAQACAGEGIRKLDLGRGVAPYKARVMSGATRVLEGSVDLRPVARHFRSTWIATRELVRNSPLYRPAGVPGRILYRLREWADFR
jgi:CelD/BcsL family acetyltransferase involved in cellulose biosynthesis